MPVAGLPVVEQVMRIYAAHGFNEFVLSLGHLKQEIVRYFMRRPQWNVECVDTGEATDTAGRIRHCLDWLDDVFLATYCDGLADIDIQALVDFHGDRESGGTLTAVPLRSQFGILHADERERVTKFVEKPVLTEHWINAGFFVFERNTFASVHGSNLEREVLPEMARRRQLTVYRHRGFWRSMDTYKDQQELDLLWVSFSADLDDRLSLRRTPDLPLQRLTPASARKGAS
jgi:glucose-1-phosphate cytidylyltransferase